jgi:hypothetical protein
MKQSDKKYFNKLANNKYVKKYRKNNKMVSIYMLNELKAELDKFCKEKNLKISQWIKALIIEALENNLKKKYDYTRREFVEIEGQTKKKRT